MRLHGFDYSVSGAYHITICTVNREKILWKDLSHFDAEDWKANLSEIGKIVDRQINNENGHKEITVDNYVIMPDHVHLLIFADACDDTRNVRRPFPARPGAQPINTTDGTADGKINELQNSRIPHYIGTLKRFTNREIGENIWQKSYHDVIIRDREEYIQIWDYIENNPRNPYDE